MIKCLKFIKFNDTISKFLEDLYDGVSDELPLGKDRIFFSKNLDFNIKELFENMSLSPERKIFALDDSNEFVGIITLSDLFKILIIEGNVNSANNINEGMGN